MTVMIFVTGGTFDKRYNEEDGELIFKESNISEMLERGRNKVDVTVRTLMMIDSLDMTEEDRKIILENCKKSSENRILITHGTDTMVETGEVLSEIKDKTIIITGAMRPWAFGSSDGLFNLGSALAFVQTLDPGVYIAMNGRCFSWDKVAKNKKTGIFEEKT